MLFKEVIMQVEVDKVKMEMIKEFINKRDEDLNEYMEVLETLKNMQPVDNGDDITIVIDWCEPECDDDEGYWRVHGYEPGRGLFWGIEYSKWSHWLGWKVDDRFIMMNGINKYVALCLWEMTWGGFEEEDIQTQIEMVLGRKEEVENGSIV